MRSIQLLILSLYKSNVCYPQQQSTENPALISDDELMNLDDFKSSNNIHQKLFNSLVNVHLQAFLKAFQRTITFDTNFEELFHLRCTNADLHCWFQLLCLRPYHALYILLPGNSLRILRKKPLKKLRCGRKG